MVASDSNRPTWHGHSDVTLIGFVRRSIHHLVQTGQYLVFVSKTHPVSIRTEDMNVRSAAQGARRKGRRVVHRVERPAGAGMKRIDQNAVSVSETVSPFRRRAFRTLNE